MILVHGDIRYRELPDVLPPQNTFISDLVSQKLNLPTWESRENSQITSAGEYLSPSALCFPIRFSFVTKLAEIWKTKQTYTYCFVSVISFAKQYTYTLVYRTYRVQTSKMYLKLDQAGLINFGVIMLESVLIADYLSELTRDRAMNILELCELAK